MLTVERPAPHHLYCGDALGTHPSTAEFFVTSLTPRLWTERFAADRLRPAIDPAPSASCGLHGKFVPHQIARVDAEP